MERLTIVKETWYTVMDPSRREEFIQVAQEHAINGYQTAKAFTNTLLGKLRLFLDASVLGHVFANYETLRVFGVSVIFAALISWMVGATVEAVNKRRKNRQQPQKEIVAVAKKDSVARKESAFKKESVAKKDSVELETTWCTPTPTPTAPASTTPATTTSTDEVAKKEIVTKKLSFPIRNLKTTTTGSGEIPATGAKRRSPHPAVFVCSVAIAVAFFAARCIGGAAQNKPTTTVSSANKKK